MGREAFCIACYAVVEPLPDGGCPAGHPATLIRELGDIPRAVAASLEASAHAERHDEPPASRGAARSAPGHVRPQAPVQVPPAQPATEVEGDALRRLAALVLTLVAVAGVCVSLGTCADPETPGPEITSGPGAGLPAVADDVATDAVADEPFATEGLAPPAGGAPTLLAYPDIEGLSVSDLGLGWTWAEGDDPEPLESGLPVDAYSVVLAFEVPGSAAGIEFRADLMRNDTGAVLLSAGPAPLDPGAATATFPAPRDGWLPGAAYTIDLRAGDSIVASAVFVVEE